MLLPEKHQRAYHQGAQINLEPHRGAHVNPRYNENEETPMVHSHLKSSYRGENFFHPMSSSRSHKIGEKKSSTLCQSTIPHALCFPLILPIMTLKSHVVEHLHHNHLRFYTSKHSPNLLTRRGVIFPTSLACGYDANWGILCIEQDREKYL